MGGDSGTTPVPTRRPRPRHPLLDRPRLREQLDGTLHGSVGLVSAAAGSGKTTAVHAWAGTVAVAADVVWLGLEARHDDPVTLADELRLALGRHVALPCVRTVEDLVDPLARACARRERPVVLVLDDVHRVTSTPGLAAVRSLVERRPAGLSLLLVGREDPPVAWHRVRASDELVELHDADLALDRAEVRALLERGFGASLASVQLDQLHRRTEGWVTGVCLVGAALRQQAHPGPVLRGEPAHVSCIATYLDREVLDPLPDDVVTFMEDTAAFGELDPEMCDELTGRRDSRATLGNLATRRLFTEEVGGDPSTFRYHRLLGTRLQARLVARDPERAAALLSAASRWHEDHDAPRTAVELALRGDPARAERLIRTASGTALRHGYARTVARWLHGLPHEVVWTDPDLAVVLGRASGLSGDLALAEAALLSARSLVSSRDEQPRPALRVGLSHLQMEVRLWQGDLGSLAGALTPAVSIVESSPAGIAADPFGLDRESVMASMALSQLLAGRWSEAAETAEAGTDYARVVRPTCASVLCLGVRALALAWLDDAQSRQAARLAARSLDAYTGLGGSPVLAHTAVAWLDDGSGTAARLAAARTLADRIGHPHLTALVALGVARWNLRRGAHVKAAQALAEAERTIVRLVDPAALSVLAQPLREVIEQDGAADGAVLGPREVEVLTVIAGGASRSQAARQLHLSVNTVKTHLRTAYAKLGAHDRDEAIDRARALGVLGPLGPRIPAAAQRQGITLGDAEPHPRFGFS